MRQRLILTKEDFLQKKGYWNLKFYNKINFLYILWEGAVSESQALFLSRLGPVCTNVFPSRPADALIWSSVGLLMSCGYIFFITRILSDWWIQGFGLETKLWKDVLQSSQSNPYSLLLDNIGIIQKWCHYKNAKFRPTSYLCYI